MTVPFLDLQAAYLELRAEIGEAMDRVLASGWYVGGPEIAGFEAAFAAYCGAGHCVGVGNGLDALHLALRAMNVGSGDEVIVASNGYIATVLAVSMVGATPVLVEPDARTHNLDPGRVEAALTPRTKVILPTHLYGQPADLDPLLELARRYGLRLLEDAAQAHGARYKGRRVGAHGDAVAWSFYPSKNLGALGDAGAVTTDDPVLAERIRTLGNYGSHRRYVNEVRGVNSRLDPVQAAVLTVKLRHLNEWNGRRAVIAGHYRTALAASGLELPFVPDWADPAWHLFVVQADAREALQAGLTEAGVQSLTHYPIPPHRQQAYRDLALPAGSLPVAERLAQRVLSLPIGPHMSATQVDAVVGAVATAMQRRAA
ncbi:DegT/DnrJ/EryC1/StrS family aminotransferase [Sphingomonas sp. BN140010]|uniref:DegT/DnrJ/EryC1/StrS family aminotransferase n=1 Tax=Sphingomonas arvum TaxID=2992113 RepID=A0ABT3JEL2_9SPHN|nr:DegT/DnrJ/EryC1/StrS family aminotransferase [Sphingomonas sp. BN140010]MCW3797510.1 DegT/DnrJ/EryC1/StrS family aminotransferase [Sphingomonas sp. BN140010]